MARYSVSLLVFLAGVFCTSCYREPIHPVTYEYRHIDKECMEYFGAAGPGSIFVYEQEGTGLVDTAVAEYTTGMGYTVDETENPRYKIRKEGYETVYNAQYSAPYRTLISYYGPDEFWFSVSYRVSGGFDVIKKNGQFIRRPGPLIRPEHTVYKIDSLRVLDTVFTDVLYMNEFYYDIFELWFAKGVGIVKKRDAANRTFLLKHWDIKNKK